MGRRSTPFTLLSGLVSYVSDEHTQSCAESRQLVAVLLYHFKLVCHFARCRSAISPVPDGLSMSATPGDFGVIIKVEDGQLRLAAEDTADQV